MEKGKVSVIVPCYNQAEFLGECLDSVLTQTYSNWECVIVNDGSQDNTEIVARQFVKEDGRFKYFVQENKGVSFARNNGILNSDGEFVLPLDADDIIAPKYMEIALQYFVRNPDVKLVYCLAILRGERDVVWQLPKYNYDQLLWNNQIFNSAIYRRSDYDKTLGYNPNMVYGLEDWDFWLSLLKPEDKVYQINEILFYYRIKQGSRNDNNNTNHHSEMCKQLIKNHLELYTPYFEKIIELKSELNETQEQLAFHKREIEQIKSSKAYRFGKMALAPFHWIKKQYLLRK